MDCADPVCQSLAAKPLEALITAEVLRALEPARLELSVHALADVQRERQRLDQALATAAGAGPDRGRPRGPAVSRR